MLFTKLTQRSFTLSTDSESTTYTLPESFNLWQIKEITKLIGLLSKNCSQSGSVVLSILLSASGSGESEATIKSAVKAIEQMSGGLLGPSAVEGFGEILSFLGEDYRIARVAAILFKKPNEKKLEESELQERAELFEAEIEPTIIWEGLTDFFTKKGKPNASINSPSPTLEATKKSGASRISAK